MPKIIVPSFGCILEPPDERDFDGELLSGDVQSQTELPKEFRVSNKQEYTNQRHIPSCVGHAVAGMKSTQEGRRLSPRDIWKKGREIYNYTGYGAFITHTLKATINLGILPYDTYEENSEFMSVSEYLDITLTEKEKAEALEFRASSYWRAGFGAKDIESIKRQMFELNTEMVTSMNWRAEFNLLNKGVLPIPKTDPTYGHAYRFCGWATNSGGREYLIFANSWGKEWGENGDFYVYTDQLDLYDMQLVKNPWSPKYYHVNGNKITWLNQERDFYWGRDAGYWGDWSDHVLINDIEIVHTDVMRITKE